MSGPAAPVTIGLRPVGEKIDENYKSALAPGLSEDEAAQHAFSTSLVSGGLQATVFAALPTPLRKSFNKLLVDKISETGCESSLQAALLSSAKAPRSERQAASPTISWKTQLIFTKAPREHLQYGDSPGPSTSPR